MKNILIRIYSAYYLIMLDWKYYGYCYLGNFIFDKYAELYKRNRIKKI